MISIHPQYIKDTSGNSLVVLPEQEFDTLMEKIEELNDIKLYDKAKKEDSGERISFADYLKKRKQKNG
ncbi:MAG: hypothetical protein CVT96_10975 [Bacteroidetes bacterium HGW-Bacteroidetes-13]|nr:MAG: hypothetical protein CVT96_10975 [Bacteroidetes bacterium HGW-Bacteroidetes-13]